MSPVATEDRPILRVDSIPMYPNETMTRKHATLPGRQPSQNHDHGNFVPEAAPKPDIPTEPAVRTAGPEELEWIAEQSRRLEGQRPEEILAWAVQRYFPRFTMATGLGPEGCVIISMLAKIEPKVYIFNLDTGYQFRETLELRERMNEKYGIHIDLQRPELSVSEYERLNGGPVYAQDSDRCCHDRKIAVLHRVAVNYDAWATGIRRDQGPTRPTHPS